MRPPLSVTRKVNPELAKAAGPILHAWSRRTSRALSSNPRQIRALAKYLPMATADVYTALGGQETLDWARSMLPITGERDEPLPMRENEIAVLGLPYGGPNGGKDSDGQFFDDTTDFLDGVIPYPPAFKTHGASNGFSSEPIGTTTGRWYDEKGGWFRVRLDPLHEDYAATVDAYNQGKLFASSGAVDASYTFDEQTGHIKTWLVDELSLVDIRDGYAPKNRYAITKAEPVLFEDYYGDVVLENPLLTNLTNALNQLLQAIRDGNGLMLSNGAVIKPETREAELATIKAEPVTDDKKDKETMADTEKCEACEEAEKLAAEVRAEIDSAEKPAKCARCPEAVQWVRTTFKAGKMSPTEAQEYLTIFTKSDELFDDAKAKFETRTPTSSTQKAELRIAAGQGQPNVQETVNEAWIEKQKLK